MGNLRPIQIDIDMLRLRRKIIKKYGRPVRFETYEEFIERGGVVQILPPAYYQPAFDTFIPKYRILTD